MNKYFLSVVFVLLLVSKAFSASPSTFFGINAIGLNGGTSGYCLFDNLGILGEQPCSTMSNLLVSTTSVLNGTNGYLLYNNAGILGNLSPGSLTFSWIQIISTPTTLQGYGIVDGLKTDFSNVSLGGVLGLSNGGTGQTSANASLNAFLPPQGGHSSQFLQTDGTNTSWTSVSGGSSTSYALCVDLRYYLDGIGGRPTYGTWLANQLTTDITSTIQYAVTQNAGQCVSISGGWWLFSSTVAVPDGTTVAGIGAEADVSVPPSSVGTVLISNQPVFNFFSVGNFVTLQALTFDRGSTSVAATSGALITSMDKNGLRYQDIYANYAYDCIDILGTQPVSSGGHHLRGISCKRFINSGLTIKNSTSIAIDDFLFVAMPGNTTAIDLRLQEATSSVRFTNGDFIYGGNAFVTSSANFGGNLNPNDIRFTNVGFDTTQNELISLNNVANISFENCWVGTSATNNGVNIFQVENVSFDKCTISNNWSSGMYLVGNPANTTNGVKIHNVDFIRNNKGNVGGVGLYAGAVSDFMVTESRFTNTTIYSGIWSGLQVNGIVISWPSSDNYIVTNNFVHGNTSTGVVDNGGGAHKNVSNNF